MKKYAIVRIGRPYDVVVFRTDSLEEAANYIQENETNENVLIGFDVEDNPRYKADYIPTVDVSQYMETVDEEERKKNEDAFTRERLLEILKNIIEEFEGWDFGFETAFKAGMTIDEVACLSTFTRNEVKRQYDEFCELY